MAEVFGVVVSAFTVAGMVSKFSTSILKLRSLWEEVQDAPEDIRQRIRQLAIVKPMLEEMEAGLRGDGQRKIRDSSAAGLSMEYCRQAVDELELLAEDLQGRILRAKRSRGLVKLKVTLKKDVLQRYHERIQFALQLLALSQQTYIIALVKNNSSESQCSQHEVGLVQIAVEDGRCQHTEPKIRADESVNILSIDRGQPKANSLVWLRPSVFGGFTYAASAHDKDSSISLYEARLRLPWWLSNKVWDLQAHRACQGWKFSVVPWITRPCDAPIFHDARHGLWADILDSLNRNQASLRDRDSDGWTLLHWAAVGGNGDVFMNLIKLGLSTQETTTGGDSVLRVLFSEKGTGEDVDKVMRLLVLTGSLDEVLPSLFEGVGNHSISETARNEDATRYAISRLVWSFPGVLQIVATELQVDPLQLPPGARYASLDWRSADPDILLDQVGRGGGWDTASFRAVLRGPEKNNLGTFAEAYFFRVQALNHKLHKASNRFFATEQKIESWRKLTRRILPAVSLEALIQSSRVRWIKPDYSLSPFFRGLLSLNCDLRYLGLTDREWRRRISRAVLMWLHDVRSSGIDLDEYGAAVRKQYLENAWLHTMRWNLYGGRGTRLVALTIGSMPEDWKLHWDFDDEEFAGEFWEMVENPPLRIPGGWVDE